MGLFDFLKRKKKTECDPAQETEELLDVSQADLSGFEPPETRYTQEYRDFLAEQEAGGRADGRDDA